MPVAVRVSFSLSAERTRRGTAVLADIALATALGRRPADDLDLTAGRLGVWRIDDDSLARDRKDRWLRRKLLSLLRGNRLLLACPTSRLLDVVCAGEPCHAHRRTKYKSNGTQGRIGAPARLLVRIAPSIFCHQSWHTLRHDH